MSNIESSLILTCGPEIPLRKFIKRIAEGGGYGFGRMNLRGFGVPVDESGAPLGVFDVECPDEAARPLVITFESRGTAADRVIMAISARFPKLLFGHLYLDECRRWVGWQVLHAGELLAGHETNNLFGGEGLWQPVAGDHLGNFHPSLGVHNGYEAISGDDWLCDVDIALLLEAVPRQLAMDHGLEAAVASIEQMAHSGAMPEIISEHVAILQADVACRDRFAAISGRSKLFGGCDLTDLRETAKRFREAYDHPSTDQMLTEFATALRKLRDRQGGGRA